MRIVKTVAAMQALSGRWRAAGQEIGFVPTMGALHEGHLSLVRAARAANRRVVVSIFVNPTQFNDPRDLAAYPSDEAGDFALLRSEHVDAVFSPAVREMYPRGLEHAKDVLADRSVTGMEGKRRPGHFDGVATIVSRLLDAVLPERAYFGEKDANQLAVVRALVKDLALPVEVVGCPTVREADGLAMSSRNRRLTPDQRRAALGLVRALAQVQAAFAAGERSQARLTAVLRGRLAASAGLRSDYAVVTGRRALVAAFAGEVRLIDNARLDAGDLAQYVAPPLLLELPADGASVLRA